MQEGDKFDTTTLSPAVASSGVDMTTEMLQQQAIPSLSQHEPDLALSPVDIVPPQNMFSTLEGATGGNDSSSMEPFLNSPMTNIMSNEALYNQGGDPMNRMMDIVVEQALLQVAATPVSPPNADMIEGGLLGALNMSPLGSEAGNSRPVSRGISDLPDTQPMEQQPSVSGTAQHSYTRQMSNDQLIQQQLLQTARQQQLQHLQLAQQLDQKQQQTNQMDMLLEVKREPDQQPMDCSGNGGTSGPSDMATPSTSWNHPVSSPTSPQVIRFPTTLEELKAALERQSTVTLGAQNHGPQAQDNLSRITETVKAIQGPSSTGARQKNTPARTASVDSNSSNSKGPLCKVCGDEASGFHYGVNSCEGCKGFFRRCITQGMSHQCSNGGRCEITPFSRNSCQCCRLAKCFSVGMSREASRLGRRPKRLKEQQQSSSTTDYQRSNSTGITPASPSVSFTPILPNFPHLTQQQISQLDMAALQKLLQSMEKSGHPSVLPQNFCLSVDQNKTANTTINRQGSANNYPDNKTSIIKQEPEYNTTSNGHTIYNSNGGANNIINTNPPVDNLKSNISDLREKMSTCNLNNQNQQDIINIKREPMSPTPDNQQVNDNSFINNTHNAATNSTQNVIPDYIRRMIADARANPSAERRVLIESVINKVVDAHMVTCNYTTEKVKVGLESFKAKMESCGGNMNMMASIPMDTNDPAKSTKMWSEFVANMVPVITRVVKFCKKMPGFDEISTQEQVNLIKNGSFQVVLARYTPLFTSDGMFVPNMEMKIPRKMIKKMPMGTFFEEQFQFARGFNSLQLTDGEVGLLTAIMIMNPASCQPDSPHKKSIFKLQSLYLHSLYFYMQSNRPDNYDELFQKVLMLLPEIQRINAEHSKTLNSMKMAMPENVQPLPDLHQEIYSEEKKTSQN